MYRPGLHIKRHRSLRRSARPRPSNVRGVMAACADPRQRSAASVRLCALLAAASVRLWTVADLVAHQDRQAFSLPFLDRQASRADNHTSLGGIHRLVRGRRETGCRGMGGFWNRSWATSGAAGYPKHAPRSFIEGPVGRDSGPLQSQSIRSVAGCSMFTTCAILAFGWRSASHLTDRYPLPGTKTSPFKLVCQNFLQTQWYLPFA